MKEIKIVSATKCDLKPSWETPIRQSIRKLRCACHVELNNTKSLASVYNKHITDENKDKILVFVHDDALIEDLFLTEKLNEAIQEFDIVGVAGIKPNITLKEPALWHLMGNKEQYSGAVAHFLPNENTKRFMTNFGLTPERTILLDGVFLAVNVENIIKTELKFDETNPARFHFYDLDFCLSANRLGIKYGTWPIWLTHKSYGLTKPDPEFMEGQSWFLQKHKAK